jgi:uncharacterized protein (DUF305 family)
MALLSDPDVSQLAPRPRDDDGGGQPWWHSVWKLVAMAVALAFLGAAVGYAVASRGADDPGAGSVDVGFLQDMRWHHDQAVAMSLALLAKPAAGQDGQLRLIADEILLDQQLESGVMVGLLDDFRQPEANETGTAMAWMHAPVPVDRMPGMATAAQLAALAKATGRDADRQYAELMIEHHQGGIHMAEYAAAHAQSARVRTMATKMATNQQGEIDELRALLRRLGG